MIIKNNIIIYIIVFDIQHYYIVTFEIRLPIADWVFYHNRIKSNSTFKFLIFIFEGTQSKFSFFQYDTYVIANIRKQKINHFHITVIQ